MLVQYKNIIILIRTKNANEENEEEYEKGKYIHIILACVSKTEFAKARLR